mmetsp:Transcript_22862/g.50113  ORF Transcript_22862/g.50113 Transcript_22862/m.50113 type:complete len:95 (+) Transcript_22862:194-478(+)
MMDKYLSLFAEHNVRILAKEKPHDSHMRTLMVRNAPSYQLLLISRLPAGRTLATSHLQYQGPDGGHGDALLLPLYSVIQRTPLHLILCCPRRVS